MDCRVAQSWVFREIDGELTALEGDSLKAHLAACTDCARGFALLVLLKRAAKALPLVEPSPYFYQRLRAKLAGVAQPVSVWQIVLGLSRQVVPTLAAITVLLLGVLAYDIAKEPQVDVVQAYDRIFMSGDRPQRMVIADHPEITDESVLQALAEDDAAKSNESDAATAPKR